MVKINEHDTGPVTIWRSYHDILGLEIGEPNVLKYPAFKFHNRLKNSLTDYVPNCEPYDKAAYFI
jgi:hypothetical protein